MLAAVRIASSGTHTSSNDSSPKGEVRKPIFSIFRPTVTPGVG